MIPQCNPQELLLERQVRHVVAGMLIAWALVLPHHTRGALVLEIGWNFTGSTYRVDSRMVPASPNEMAGDSHFVEFINGRFSVYDKANSRRLWTMADTDFWASAGVTLPGGYWPADPRILFDVESQRWFASMIDVNNQLNANHFLLAVSATADPTGSWHGFAFTADPVQGNFADFPTLGIDTRGVYRSGNLYTSGGKPVAGVLVAIPKSDLLADLPSIDGRTFFGLLDSASHGVVLQPAVTLTPTSDGEAVLAACHMGYDMEYHSTLMQSVVRNAATPGSATLDPPVTMAVPAFSIPLNPVQPGGVDTLDDGDSRFSGLVYRIGDALYAVHSTQNGPFAAIQWFKIDAIHKTVIETGTISDPTLDLFYPSIAANPAGTVVIACNGCSPTSYISSYAVVGETINGSIQFGDLTLLKAGTATYDIVGSNLSMNHWGDYSTTSLDPVDSNRFWTVQVVPVERQVWSTQITELITSPLRLNISVDSDGNLVASWPTAASGFELYAASILSAGDWAPVAGTPELKRDRFVVTMPPAGAQGFLRLQKR